MYVVIWDHAERFLWGVAFTLILIVAFLYLKKAREREDAREKKVMYGFSAIMFGFIFFIIFHYIKESLIIGSYKNNIFYSDYGNTGIIHESLRKLTWLSFFMGFLLFILAFEFSFKRTKFLLTIFESILILIFLIFPFESGINTIVFIISGLIFNIIMIVFIKWSEIEFKTISSYILTGMVFICHGFPQTMQNIKELNVLPVWISPLLVCIGSLFIIIPFFITPEPTSRTLKIWMVNSFFSIALQIFLLIFYISTGFPIDWYIGTVTFMIILIYIQYLNLKTIKLYFSNEKSFEKRAQQPNILSIFTKPEKLTEEEVSVAKEKKICLVCKNKMERFNIYICPECDTLYCEKCARTLSDLENICWVCETPFDESKPVKLPEKKEEEEIEIERAKPVK